MPVHLVKRAIEQSRTRGPFVHSMALLSGSRVLAGVDRQAARQAFAEGIPLAESLPLEARRLRHVLDDAVRFGALADPAAAVALYRRMQSHYPASPGHSAGTMLVQSLAQGGELHAALELLEDPACDTGGAQIIVQHTGDPALQRRAMIAARDRWRRLRQNPDSAPGFLHHEFTHLFSRHWRILEGDEPQAWLDELLQSIEHDPDQPANSGFGERVQFYSRREAHLFEILGALRALKPAAEVDAILARYRNVSAAAGIYPLGLESLIPPRPPAATARKGFLGSGSGFGSRDRRPPGGAMTLEEARRLHRQDIDPEDPNLAPHVFWPSCHAYKAALYWAGRNSGMAAEPLLDQVPDTDFAILAAIELAAGILALPEPFGVRMEHHPRRRP